MSGAARPVPQEERQLDAFDLSILWFGAAISIAEIWAGGQSALSGLGLGLGLVAILLGRAIGNGLMAAVAALGARSGLPTMALTRPVFGLRGSYVLSTLNVLQLVGWTGWMVFVGIAYLDALTARLGLPSATESTGLRLLYCTVLTGLCIIWAVSFARHKYWRIIERSSGALLLLLTIWMTYVVLSKYPLASIAGSSGGSFFSGVDLVIAMSVSWLPLAADYSVRARSPQAGAAGTFWGYLAGGSWMYAVGLLVALATQSAEPEALVVGALGSLGLRWAVLAIAMVLLSTVTTAFLDIYSAAVSAQNLGWRLSSGRASVIVGLFGGALGFALDAYGYAPFLTAIGAVFLPAFVVVLSEYYLYRRDPGTTMEAAHATRPAALIAWLIGFLAFDAAGGWPSLNYFLGLVGTALPALHCPLGASVPAIVAALSSYALLRRLWR